MVLHLSFEWEKSSRMQYTSTGGIWNQKPNNSWNNLPADIRNVQIFQCFKSELLNHNISN